MDFSFTELNYNSVETLPSFEARAAFTVNSSSVFREDVDIVPTFVDDTLSYIPWGGDNQMPFDLLALVEKDETLATCQCFNAEVCYGSGLQYCVAETSAAVKSAVEDFTLDNDLAAYFLGICQDFKHFGFAVSVLILNDDGSRIVRLLRKEACYCRFTPADSHGRISKILSANWRKAISSRSDIKDIDLLDTSAPWQDLQERLTKKSKVRKFTVHRTIVRLKVFKSKNFQFPLFALPSFMFSVSPSTFIIPEQGILIIRWIVLSIIVSAIQYSFVSELLIHTAKLLNFPFFSMV